MRRYEFVFTDAATNLDRFDCTIEAEGYADAYDKFWEKYSDEDIENVEVEEFTLQEVSPGVHGWRSTYTELLDSTLFS